MGHRTAGGKVLVRWSVCNVRGRLALALAWEGVTAIAWVSWEGHDPVKQGGRGSPPDTGVKPGGGGVHLWTLG